MNKSESSVFNFSPGFSLIRLVGSATDKIISRKFLCIQEMEERDFKISIYVVNLKLPVRVNVNGKIKKYILFSVKSCQNRAKTTYFRVKIMGNSHFVYFFNLQQTKAQTVD